MFGKILKILFLSCWLWLCHCVMLALIVMRWTACKEYCIYVCRKSFKTLQCFKQQLKIHLIMIEINTLVLTYTPAQRARLDEEDSLTKNWAQNVILTKLQKTAARTIFGSKQPSQTRSVERSCFSTYIENDTNVCMCKSNIHMYMDGWKIQERKIYFSSEISLENKTYFSFRSLTEVSGLEEIINRTCRWLIFISVISTKILCGQWHSPG